MIIFFLSFPPKQFCYIPEVQNAKLFTAEQIYVVIIYLQFI